MPNQKQIDQEKVTKGAVIYALNNLWFTEYVKGVKWVKLNDVLTAITALPAEETPDMKDRLLVSREAVLDILGNECDWDKQATRIEGLPTVRIGESRDVVDRKILERCLKDNMGVGIHTALRKWCNSKERRDAHEAITKMPDEEWSAFCDGVIDVIMDMLPSVHPVGKEGEIKNAIDNLRHAASVKSHQTRTWDADDVADVLECLIEPDRYDPLFEKQDNRAKREADKPEEKK